MTRAALLAELRPYISDERVLVAIGAVPRERFVARRDRRRAWENRALGIDCGQTISQPLVVARMCEALAVGPGQRVLEVGTGSGYHAAVLAALGAQVVSVEIHAELAATAATRLHDVELVVGDGRLGYPDRAPYDGISVAATAQDRVPRALLEQLAPGGRLVAPIRADRTERLVLLVRREDGGLDRRDLAEVRFVPLV